MMLSKRFIAVMLVAVLAAAGLLAFSERRPVSGTADYSNTPAPIVRTSLAQNTAPTDGTYTEEFKAGFVEGFNAGVAGYAYPQESAFAGRERGYLDGYNQGFTDGQSQQANLRNLLCGQAGMQGASNYAAPGYPAPSSGVAGTRSYNGGSNYSSAPRETVDNGMGSTARKALMIAGGAGAGAGIGGALGGKKGAAIGALVGGGTGTALALTKKPSRAFNRRVTGKSTLKKGLIGAGIGAGIGALTGGKRGAAAGAALGGGGGVLWSLMTGEKRRR